MRLDLDKPIRAYRHWHYKNTILLVLSLILFFYFADTPFIKNVINKIGDFGYAGALLTGIFFVSTFTVAPALVVLYALAQSYNPIGIAVMAGLGAVIGDFMLFQYLKDKVFGELKPLFLKFGGSYVIRLFKTPYFGWLTPLIGAAIIASPFPDEIGVGILGISKLKNWQFLLLSFCLNTVGILIVITLARAT